MDLHERIAKALKQAMKDKQPARLATLRLINAAIKDQEIAARGRGDDDGDGARIDDSQIRAILSRMIKQRQESVRAYEEGGRLDLAEREREEITVIEEFLPRRLTMREVDEAIERTINEFDARSIRDMGKIMSRLKERHAGQIDFGEVGPRVKERLSGG